MQKSRETYPAKNYYYGAYLKSGPSEPGGGYRPSPRILADGADYAHHIATRPPPGFSELPSVLKMGK